MHKISTVIIIIINTVLISISIIWPKNILSIYYNPVLLILQGYLLIIALMNYISYKQLKNTQKQERLKRREKDKKDEENNDYFNIN